MLVVILHAYATLNALERSAPLMSHFVPDNGFGAFGVDLFFVISGAVMGMALERGTSPGPFLRARFARVVPLFWLAAIATIALNLLLGKPLAIESLANSVTILPLLDSGVINPPLPSVGWTLAFELYFYLIVALALYLPKRLRFEAVLAALMLCALIGELTQPVLVPILGISCNALLLEFALGLLALRAARNPLVRRYALSMSAMGISPLLYSMIFGFGFSGAPQAAVAGQTSVARMLAWGLPSALLLSGLLARPDRMRANNVLARFGDASYSIYLVHTSVMMVVPLIWPPIAGNDLLFIALVVSSGLTGLIAHRWIEQPLLDRLRAKRQSFGVSAAGFA